MLLTNYIINLQDFFNNFGLHAFIDVSLETMVIILISTIITVSSITLLSGRVGKTLDIGAKVVGILSGGTYLTKTYTEGGKGSSGSNNNSNNNQSDDDDKKKPENSGKNENDGENNNTENTSDDSSTNK